MNRWSTINRDLSFTVMIMP